MSKDATVTRRKSHDKPQALISMVIDNMQRKLSKGSQHNSKMSHQSPIENENELFKTG